MHCCITHDAHNAKDGSLRPPNKPSDHPLMPLLRDARPVLSTARSSIHRTGEFAVLYSARDALFHSPRPSWSR
ncbi:uncharacterized protein SCHCODRAFT_02555129 [Schizophyllum commune H4-8]|uniref:Expressed protein n=1 Tax=Schizophyllum commune (strain H4-8 / FGSC 9210) TaxID=578458 RepID=D8QJJ0_SCHCM|nr:uncharacterized protein SCHCODRAFT_02555129 [Schizophyllum commune H4-8]KAI5886306.1 hypothetical protein SCHCODRAFT_02555129 [Schizophyllum commune H4-8]